MAIYRQGQASMDAQGYVTGYDTKWREQLTLIRPGATIFFLTQPLQAAVITEVISDTSIRAITTGGAVVQKTNYLILLHDSLTVDGLAQDVAETLRYYQSKETVIEEAIEFFKDFDIDSLKQLVDQVKQGAESAKQSAEAAKTSETNAVNARNDAEQFKNAAKASQDASANSATAAKGSQDAAKASEDKAKQYAESIQPGNFLVKSQNLNDLADKGVSRKNLSAYYQSWVNLDETNIDNLKGEQAGLYFQGTSAFATPERGYPVKLAGSLQVISNRANGNDACHQIYRPHNSQAYFYSRWYDPTRQAWSAWFAFYAQESTNTYRTRIGLGDGNSPQFQNLNLVRNNDAQHAAAGILTGYLNNTSGQKRLGYRVYGEIRGDNKEWLTLHLSNADSSINKYAGLDIDGNFSVNGNFIGNAISVSDVKTTKVNLAIDRLDQISGGDVTRLYSGGGQTYFEVRDAEKGVWGVYNRNTSKWKPLDIGQGGTGGTTIQEAKENLQIPYSGFENMVIVDAPSGAVDGKYYPVIIKMPTDDLRYLGSEIAIQTRSGIAADPMNSCTFTGYIRSSGASDRKQCAYGAFSQYDPNEKSIHSVLMSGTSDEGGYTAFYIEKRAFPVKVRVAQRCEVIVPTADFKFSDVVFKWGASNPVAESTKASEILRFSHDSGFYSSIPIIAKSRSVVETANNGYIIRGSASGTTQALYYSCEDATRKRLFYIGKTGNSTDVVFNNDMRGSSVVVAGDINAVTQNRGGGFFVDGTALVVRRSNGKLFRFENSATSAQHATISLWGNTTGRPSVIEAKLDNGYLFYAQQNQDGSRVLNVNGAAQATAFNQVSDRDLKDNIEEIENATESLRKMSGYTYTLKENGLPYAGVIAQEVMEAIPEAVSGFTQYTDLAGPTKDGNQLVGEERFLSVDYGAVTGLLVKVCRESDDRISKLEKEVAELKDLLSKLINNPTTLN